MCECLIVHVEQGDMKTLDVVAQAGRRLLASTGWQDNMVNMQVKEMCRARHQ